MILFLSISGIRIVFAVIILVDAQSADECGGFGRVRIQVSDGRDIHLLTLGEIIRCYTEGQKVLVQTPGGVFQSGLKLYELEEKLLPGDFVRISRSELVNIHCIRQLDMNLIGTIRVILSDGTETYTSRRCIPMLKEALGLKVQKGGYHEEK